MPQPGIGDFPRKRASVGRLLERWVGLASPWRSSQSTRGVFGKHVHVARNPGVWSCWSANTAEANGSCLRGTVAKSSKIPPRQKISCFSRTLIVADAASIRSDARSVGHRNTVYPYLDGGPDAFYSKSSPLLELECLSAWSIVL